MSFSDDPFGTDDSLPLEMVDGPVADQEQDTVDSQWRDSDFVRPRVSCPVIFSGPSSRVFFDGITRTYESRAQSAIAQLRGAALRSFAGALAGTTSQVSAWLPWKQPATEEGPTRIMRVREFPVRGLPSNLFAARVVRNGPPAGSLKDLDDACLDHSMLRLIQVPSLSTARNRSSGHFIPQRPDALTRFAQVYAAAGSIQLICASLDHLYLSLRAEAKARDRSTITIDRKSPAMGLWFRQIAISLDAIYGATRDLSPVLLLLDLQSDTAFQQSDLTSVMSEIFALSQVVTTDHRAVRGGAVEDTSSRSCSSYITAIIVAKCLVGPPGTARAAVSNEVAVTGISVICSAINATEGPLRGPSASDCDALSIRSADDVIAAIEALALHLAVSVTGHPQAFLPQPMLDCDSAIRRAKDESGRLLTTTLSNVRRCMTAAGLDNTLRRQKMLRLLHLWGTLFVPPYDFATWEDIADIDNADTTQQQVCWRPDALLDAVSALASRLAPRLYRDEVPDIVPPESAEAAHELVSSVGFAKLTSHLWAGSALVPPQEDTDDGEEFDRVQDRTCVLTAADAYLLFAPVLQRLYAPHRSEEDVILVSEIDVVTDLMARSGLLIKLRRRQAVARTSSEAVFDDRMLRYLAPPFVSRAMPRAIPHLFAVLVRALGLSPRWIRVNLNPCSVLGSLMPLLSDRLDLLSVMFGAERPQNVVSVWANGFIFSSVDHGGLESITLVAAPADHSGSPLHALLVCTLQAGGATTGDGVESTPDYEGDIGYATVIETLHLLQISVLPGLAYEEAVPCPHCLREAVPNPDTDWVNGWATTSDATISSKNSPVTTSGVNDSTSSLLRASDAVCFFAKEFLQHFSGAGEQPPARDSFSCPRCGTTQRARSIVARGFRTLTGLAANDEVGALPSFLPDVCKPTWNAVCQTISTASAKGSADAPPGQSIDATFLCRSAEAVVKAVLFHDTFEKPPPLPSETHRDAEDADDWDHVDEAA